MAFPPHHIPVSTQKKNGQYMLYSHSNRSAENIQLPSAAPAAWERRTMRQTSADTASQISGFFVARQKYRPMLYTRFWDRRQIRCVSAAWISDSRKSG
jgi:hypothetical protein